MAAIAARPATSWAVRLPRLLRGRSAGRGHPSAAARRCRATSALVAFAAIGALFGAGSLAGAGQAAAPAAAATVAAESAVAVAATSQVVQPGDTLWSLARRLQPDGDVRPLVARLRTAAGGGTLVPGQRIRLAA